MSYSHRPRRRRPPEKEHDGTCDYCEATLNPENARHSPPHATFPAAIFCSIDCEIDAHLFGAQVLEASIDAEVNQLAYAKGRGYTDHESWPRYEIATGAFRPLLGDPPPKNHVDDRGVVYFRRRRNTDPPPSPPVAGGA